VGIDQSCFVPIGGLDQWISVKGQDRHNPVLLVVHGGAGESQSPTADKYLPWEKAFTLGPWDQRGAGHDYSRDGAKTPDGTLDRIARDGIEVTEYLLRTLDRRRSSSSVFPGTRSSLSPWSSTGRTSSRHTWARARWRAGTPPSTCGST
jgi:hypothetical protein